ncbi:MAG: homoserine O-acetyltransferase [Pseudomonadota bacterium]
MQDYITSIFGINKEKIEVGQIIYLAKDQPLNLSCGSQLNNFPLAYQTYGQLNEQKSNAILLCHALTGDQYAASVNPVTGRNGWWDHIIGPGKILDSDKYFIICPNILGGCMGSTGPKSLNPSTNDYYNLDFPFITIGDMVAAQNLLIQSLGIEKLFAVIGGSMGGMLALEWAAKYKDKVLSAMIIASGARHSAQNIALNEIGRQAIMSDPEWRNGNYLQYDTLPEKGLALARMTAHVTYLSEDALQRKFGRQLNNSNDFTYKFEADFQVENYLRYQANNFIKRFDPNSYLYISKAMDYFDLSADYDGILANAFKNTTTNFCVISFSSDWLFPTSESKYIVHALNASGAGVTSIEIQTDKGHDAFLLDEPEFFDAFAGFMHNISLKQDI